MRKELRNKLLDLTIGKYRDHQQMEERFMKMYTEILVGDVGKNIEHVIDTLKNSYNIDCGRLHATMQYCDMYELGYHHIKMTPNMRLKDYEYLKDLYATSMAIYEISLEHGGPHAGGTE